MALITWRAASTFVLCASVASLAACAPASPPADEPSTAKGTPAEPVDAGFTTPGIIVGGVTGEGPNRRAALLAGDMTSLLVGRDAPLGEHFTDVEIEGAFSVASHYMVEKVIDGGHLYTVDRDEALKWLDDLDLHEQSPMKAWVTEMFVENNMAPFFNNSSDGKAWRGIPDPDRPTENGSHFDDVTLELVEARTTPENDTCMGFEFQTTTQRAVLDPNAKAKDVEALDEHNLLDSLVYVCDERGEWKLMTTGWSSSTRTLPAGEAPEFEPHKSLWPAEAPEDGDKP